jgi:hypothetical protein
MGGATEGLKHSGLKTRGEYDDIVWKGQLRTSPKSQTNVIFQEYFYFLVGKSSWKSVYCHEIRASIIEIRDIGWYSREAPL